jgi:hypothetical protein
MQFRELLALLNSLPRLPGDERRESVRLRCDIGVTCALETGTCSASVVDVTLRGLGLELNYQLEAKQRLQVCRDDFGPPVPAEVIWCRRRLQDGGYRVGLRYHAEPESLRDSWLTPALKQTGFKAEHGEQRKLLRVPGRVACRLSCQKTQQRADAEMLDLSLGGASVESSEEFRKGQTLDFVTVPLGGLPPLKGSARVVSSRKRSDGLWRSGLRFLECNQDYAHTYMRSMLASVWAGRE